MNDYMYYYKYTKNIQHLQIIDKKKGTISDTLINVVN